MKGKFLLLITLVTALVAHAQKPRTENLIIVTVDGLRWQEVFGGIDDSLVNNPLFTRDAAGMKAKFNAATAEEKRNRLFPFLWNVVHTKGQLYGNRLQKSFVNNANKYKFSYPGYNEIFTGYPDDSVNANNKIWNKNVNVLEYLNQQPGYKNRVAVFATWDVFPYILNSKRNGMLVNAHMDSLPFKEPSLQLINEMQFLTTQPLGVRPDIFTYFAAREYCKAYKPKVLYIAFDETDDFAHAGMYDQYIKSAHAQDAMIADIWNTVQSLPEYKNKTTLLITTDHGRGDAIKTQWKDHGQNIADADEIWIAAMGPDTKPLGEVKNSKPLFQGQLASTIASLLGVTFEANHKVLPPITTIYK